MSKVFISHSAKDRDFVEQEIIGPLNRHGIETWYSKDNIETATLWEQKIREGLKSCDWFLVVMTPDSVASEWVQAEVHWALEKRKDRVVPVLRGDCNPEDLHLKLLRIQHIDFRGNLAEAQKKLLALWGVEETALARLYEQAQTAFTAEEWATVITKLQALLKAQPAHAGAQELLAEARRRQDLSNLYAAGQAHFQAGRWREALADLERVRELGGAYRDVTRLVAEAQEQLIAARIGVLFQEAEAAAASENWAVVVKKLKEILSVEPAHAEAQRKLDEAQRQQQLAGLYEVGRKLYREGRWADALVTLYAVQRMTEDYKDVAALVAKAEVSQQQLEQAHAKQESAPAAEAQAGPPQATQAVPATAATPEATADSAQPAREQQRPAYMPPDKPIQTEWMKWAAAGAVMLLVVIGVIIYATNHRSSSVLTENVPTNNINSAPSTVNQNSTPVNAESKNNTADRDAAQHDKLGDDLLHQQKYAEAEKEYREAVRLEPNNAVYHEDLGIALNRQEKYEEAVAQDREAVRLDPSKALYHTNLGRDLVNLKKYAEAEAEAREAVRLKPDSDDYHDDLSIALYYQNQYTEAVVESREAIRLNPNNAPYYVNLGNSLRMQNKRNEAAEVYKKALQLDPNNKYARSGLEKVQ
jgi:tetratricopeptide (TPR) repeat protein